jgi:hypothetical protein
VGLDLLPDYFFKSRKVFNAILPKLEDIFNGWANHGDIPIHQKIGKIFALSKCDAAYNPYPKVRLINVM